MPMRSHGFQQGGFLRGLPSTYTMYTRLQADCLNLRYADVSDNTELIVYGHLVVTQINRCDETPQDANIESSGSPREHCLRRMGKLRECLPH